MTAILIVEDEAKTAETVRLYLERAGYEVAVAGDGRSGLALARSGRFGLVVLDLMLPEIDGLTVCQRLRHESDVRILMLTARSTEDDRIGGLDLGADDYVTKPFSPRELTLRVGAVLRRKTAGGRGGAQLEHANLRLDPDRHRCFVAGQEITLTAKEFDLLMSLMSRPGRVMTRDVLLEQVWGTDIAVTSRTIDTHLKRLREKLGPAGSLIETVRGVGYRFAE